MLTADVARVDRRGAASSQRDALAVKQATLAG